MSGNQIRRSLLPDVLRSAESDRISDSTYPWNRSTGSPRKTSSAMSRWERRYSRSRRAMSLVVSSRFKQNRIQPIANSVGNLPARIPTEIPNITPMTIPAHADARKATTTPIASPMTTPSNRERWKIATMTVFGFSLAISTGHSQRLKTTAVVMCPDGEPYAILFARQP